MRQRDAQKLNALQQRSYDGSTTCQWKWRLATTAYSAAPQRKPSGTGQEGTRAPIDPAVFGAHFRSAKALLT